MSCLPDWFLFQWYVLRGKIAQTVHSEKTEKDSKTSENHVPWEGTDESGDLR